MRMRLWLALGLLAIGLLLAVLVLEGWDAAQPTRAVRVGGGCFLSIGDGCNVTVYQELTRPFPLLPPLRFPTAAM